MRFYQILNEKTISITNHLNESFRVHVNPSLTQMKQMFLDRSTMVPYNERAPNRALLDFTTGTFYIWEAYWAIHDEVIVLLGLDLPFTIKFSVWPDFKFEHYDLSWEIGKELKLKFHPEKLNSENFKTYLKSLRNFKLPVK